MEEFSDCSVLCFLCKRDNSSLVDIRYKMDRNSVKEDLMELYGDAVENYISGDDMVCWSCAQVVENMTILKRHLYEVIVDHHVSVQVHNKPGTKAFDFLNTWSYTPLLESARSPNDLLMVTGSIPYVERDGYDTPALDREVQHVTSRSRSRRKGHNWTRKKGSQNRNNSLHSRSISRYSYTSRGSKTSRVTANSATSRTTISNRKKNLQESLKKHLGGAVGDLFYRSDSFSRFSREYIKKNFLNDSDDYFEVDDILPTNGMSIRTRFATKIRDELLRQYDHFICECPHSKCKFTAYNIEKLTEHRVDVHKEMAMFLCEQCNFYYLSQDNLDKHVDIHFKTFIAYCIYCWEEYTNKRLYEKHLNEHLIYSHPCKYCDKFFLRKNQKEKHVKEEHSNPDTRIRKPKQQLILDRIDKNPQIDDEHVKNVNESSEFVVKILCQDGASSLEDSAEETDLSSSPNVDNDQINLSDIMS
ncbi:hypothetical protein RI129_007709 [Pyrocoelia pectoralis]|uniref:C2H2-type domain-containing protein n=1 Tax=Pyrocoelia pectoralis TaxID=417401 RepID=A0AAN7VI70_9COLE